VLEHKKEHIFHGDIRPGDRLFYQTSTSWMMWNWLVSGLASGATILLFDGDPLLEDGLILWRMAEEERVTHFGTSAAFLGVLEKQGCKPATFFQFDALRVLDRVDSVSVAI
jgi:acetoacetyl-CoA synthetase